MSYLIFILRFHLQIPLACIFFKFVSLALHTPSVSYIVEGMSTLQASVAVFLVGLFVLGLKVLTKTMLMAHVRSMYAQDLLDSRADDLDKDVVERLSSIERYTVLRSDSVLQM
jgi:hypothetical protein